MNITLIGMPGAGKSYMGKILAERYNFEFIDTDILLENKFQKKLQQIVDEIGQDNFLLEEATVMSELENKSNIIISPGGSVVYSGEAMNFLKKISKIVFLNVPLSMLKARIDEGSRGIIGMKGKSFEELYNERLPLYFKYADVVIDDTEIKTADDIVAEVTKGL